MREIKYRAWDLIGSTMRHVSFIEFDAVGEICNIALPAPALNTKNAHHARFEERENGDDLILMQYTGLKDKNGKDVYEGDIVRLIERGGYIKATGNITWRNARYYLQRGSEEDLSLFSPTYPENLEIIGNLYETPELLQ